MRKESIIYGAKIINTARIVKAREGGELISKNIDVEVKLGSKNFQTINEFCNIELETD